MIKNTYKSLENKTQARIADDTLDNKSGAILVISIEPERQGKILNTCNSSNGFFEAKKGTLVGMNINSILPKAFCVKHNESLSKVYARSKLTPCGSKKSRLISQKCQFSDLIEIPFASGTK